MKPRITDKLKEIDLDDILKKKKDPKKGKKRILPKKKTSIENLKN